MSARGHVRERIATEAARLMYEESVKEYFTAKRMAAKRVLGRVQAKRIRYRPEDLPSNGEIRDALLALAESREGPGRTERLFDMRVQALEAMDALMPFHPRLIGSVSTGHIRRGSDIDLSLFCDSEETVERHLLALGWPFEAEHVRIQKFGEIRNYLHYHVTSDGDEAHALLELTLYPARELRFRPRSSTDGKPIVRLTRDALSRLLLADHAPRWEEYRRRRTQAPLDRTLPAPQGRVPV